MNFLGGLFGGHKNIHCFNLLDLSVCDVWIIPLLIEFVRDFLQYSTCACFSFLWKNFLELPNFSSIKSRRFAGLISRGVARSSSLVFCRDRCIARASVSHSVIVLASTFCCKFRIDRDLFNSSCFSSLVRPLFSTRESGGFQHLITPIRDPVHCLKTPGPSDVLSRRKVALTELWSVKDDGWCLWKQEVTMLIRPGESNMKSILPCCLPIMSFFQV